MDGLMDGLTDRRMDTQMDKRQMDRQIGRHSEIYISRHPDNFNIRYIYPYLSWLVVWVLHTTVKWDLVQE